MITYLIFNPKRLQDLEKAFSEICASVRPRHFKEIEKHRHRFPFVFEMHCNCHVGLVIRRRPRICGEVQLPVVFLTQVSISDH